MKNLLGAFFLGIALMASQSAQAARPDCNDAGIFGAGLFSKMCWSCMFPIKIAGGVEIGTGISPPHDASDDIVSVCYNGPAPSPGFNVGARFNDKIFEVVQTPYCSPVLGGNVIGGINLGATLQGHLYDSGTSQTGSSSRSRVKMNSHLLSFPLAAMMEFLTSKNCLADGYTSMDLLDITEVNPFANEAELACMAQPFNCVLAGPVGILACSIRAMAQGMTDAVGFPETFADDAMSYCAGWWGMAVPYINESEHQASPPRDTSLLATRHLGWLHYMGRARKTVGDEATCGGYIFPTLPKSQYKFQQIFPVNESETGKCCHSIGQSQYTWGEWRNAPGQEVYVHGVYRWVDCNIGPN